VRRSIFYPASLLSHLGWPNETDRLAAARARFHDLLKLPRSRVSVSTFTLEDDAIVAGSSFLQEIEASGLPLERLAVRTGRWFTAVPRRQRAAWLALRSGRSPEEGEATRRCGSAPRGLSSAMSSVISLVRSNTSRRACAARRAEHESDSPAGARQLLHGVQAFFARWHDRGGRRLPPSRSETRRLFRSVADRSWRTSAADRARTHLPPRVGGRGGLERAFNFRDRTGRSGARASLGASSSRSNSGAEGRDGSAFAARRIGSICSRTGRCA
jgi:hypothetical protein